MTPREQLLVRERERSARRCEFELPVRTHRKQSSPDRLCMIMHRVSELTYFFHDDERLLCVRVIVQSTYAYVVPPRR